MTKHGRVIKAYDRLYDNPIQVRKGDVVRVTERDMWQDRYLWLWCIADTGKEGWTPDVFIQLEGDQGTLLRDYNATELTSAIGDNLLIIEEVGGWYWARKVTNEYGWIPTDCVALDLI
jgi:hypothetical protein